MAKTLDLAESAAEKAHALAWSKELNASQLARVEIAQRHLRDVFYELQREWSAANPGMVRLQFVLV